MIDPAKLIGRQFGTVVIIKELGRGTMGIVFLGFQKSLKRQVAVKVLSKSGEASESARQKFRDEAETIAALSHPNIIPIFEMGEEDEFYFQVMQLISGSDLHHILENQRKHPVPSKRVLPLTETLEIVAQVLDGLGYAHEEGIVHQ